MHHVTLPFLRILLSALLSAAAFWAAGVRAAEPLRIATLPMESREATVHAFNPVVTYLQQHLKQPVELVYFEKNSDIVNAMLNRALDIAMLGPLPYVSMLKRGGDAEPLVFFKEASGEAQYRCVLVKFDDKALSSSALRGKRAALTQPLSTCGYLGTNAILRQHVGLSLEEMRYRYYNTHEAAALAVVSGEADIAGIKDEFAVKFAGLGLVVAARSETVPALGLFANRATLPKDLIAEIRRVLLATPESVYRRWGNAMHYGMVPAADTDFDALRRFGDPGSIPTEAKTK